jgi:electron transport complex protein RnfB
MAVVLNILFAFLVVTVLGVVLGLGLAFAAKVLAVKKDERINDLVSALPGLNCGACGFAGCASYAEAILSGGGNVALNRCTPGGANALKRLSEIMGVTVSDSDKAVKMVAQVHCRGKAGSVTKESFRYEGMRDCNALHILYGGNLECKYGCLGEGSCIRVCPTNAISYDAEGLVWVDKELCISCGKCIQICPTGVIRWVPYDADFIVACSNHDKGAAVRKYCGVGCIACKLCEKKSPEGGFKVEDNLAGIDYTATGSRVEAAFACPPQCIIAVDNQTVKPKEYLAKPAKESSARPPAAEEAPVRSAQTAMSGTPGETASAVQERVDATEPGTADAGSNGTGSSGNRAAIDDRS